MALRHHGEVADGVTAVVVDVGMRADELEKAQHDDLDHTGSLTQERLDFLDHFNSCGQD